METYDGGMSSAQWRCLDASHLPNCNLCEEPPLMQNLDNYMLRGDPGLKNGEKKLRSLTQRVQEWDDQASREHAAQLAEAEGRESLIAAIRGKNAPGLRKAHLVFLARTWRYKSDIWKVKKTFAYTHRPAAAQTSAEDHRSYHDHQHAPQQYQHQPLDPSPHLPHHAQQTFEHHSPYHYQHQHIPQESMDRVAHPRYPPPNIGEAYPLSHKEEIVENRTESTWQPYNQSVGLFSTTDSLTGFFKTEPQSHQDSRGGSVGERFQGSMESNYLKRSIEEIDEEENSQSLAMSNFFVEDGWAPPSDRTAKRRRYECPNFLMNSYWSADPHSLPNLAFNPREYLSANLSKKAVDVLLSGFQSDEFQSVIASVWNSNSAYRRHWIEPTQGLIRQLEQAKINIDQIREQNEMDKDLPAMLKLTSGTNCPLTKLLDSIHQMWRAMFSSKGRSVPFEAFRSSGFSCLADRLESSCRQFSKTFDVDSIDPNSMTMFFTVGSYTGVSITSQLLSLLAWSKAQSLETYIQTSLAIREFLMEWGKSMWALATRQQLRPVNIKALTSSTAQSLQDLNDLDSPL